MIVDVHTHMYPLAYIDLLEKREKIPRIVNKNARREFIIFPEEDGPRGVGGREMGPENWSVERKLEIMDVHGIDMSVVSLGNPWLNPFTEADDVEIAERINTALARIEDESRGRLFALGVLPASSAKAAASMVPFIARNKSLYGIISGPTIAGLLLDDSRLDSVWDKLVEFDVPLFFHPENGVALDLLQGHRHALPVGVGFPLETTIALTRLIFGGVLERFPNLRILVAHGGGTLPYLSGRMDAAWQSDPEVSASLPKPPSTYLRMLWLDALVYHAAALNAAARLVGTDRLMFGTDDPFSVSDPGVNLDIIKAELDASGESQSVLAENAVSFFGLP